MQHDDSLLSRQLDEYVLVRQLGQGGMARIYLGLDRRLQRYAAIKVIDKPLRAEQEYVQRFEQEAQTIAQLEHPHIVRLYRYGEVGGLMYMAMQYIAGSDLAAVLRSYREDGEYIPLEEAARIIREIGEALDYAHARGVIHRDVTPGNIMLDEQGKAYLADFGLAFYSELDDSLDVFGTPHYMAPEQVHSSANVVPQSDLYALGVILYQMVTGERPFAGEDPMVVARRQQTEAPRRPQAIRPAAGEAVEAVILKAMAKDPAERYASGTALADALDAALATPSAQALPPTDPKLTIPGRVTMVRRPDPPQPKAVVRPPSQAEAPDGAVSMPRIRRRALLLAGTGLVLLLLCVGLAAALANLIGADGEGTPVAGLGATPTLALTATATTPASGSTASPTPTPSATDTATPTTQPATARFSLELISSEDSLFIINRSEEALPLPELRLEGERGGIDGEEWEVSSLHPLACVTLWKEEGQPSDPDITCVEVGWALTRSSNERFWKDRFSVIYDGEVVGQCRGGKSTCEITIRE